MKGLPGVAQRDSCFLVPPPNLHSGGQARPRDEGLGSRRCLPGSPCCPLRPCRPGRPGTPAAPSLPSGARHTSWVTVEARDMASTQTTSQPPGASMMPLRRQGQGQGRLGITHAHPTYTQSHIYTPPHPDPIHIHTLESLRYPLSSSRNPTHTQRTTNLHRYTHATEHTHTISYTSQHTDTASPCYSHTTQEANPEVRTSSWTPKPTPK